ncbi:acylaminoacyl-peptidase [Pararobbsia alpina]|uniref:S9 family peptidase n=1 Tax=Pararobbsia alpina TaxID=621374 RepID=UPI0039A4C952
MTDSATPHTPSSHEAPYGSWRSPITTDLIVGATIRLGQADIGSGRIVWTEGRPSEQGRNVLVGCRLDDVLVDARDDAREGKNTQDRITDLSPSPFNIRTLVHEYGGGAFVTGADAVWFSHFDDQQIYRIDLSSQGGLNGDDRGGDHGDQAQHGLSASAPVQVTHAPGMRFADAIVDVPRNRLICVAEDHRDASHEAINTLVSVDLATGEIQTLVQGHDFFSSPTLRADGAQLAWLTWDHPNLPWDGTQLWLADIGADGTPGPARCIAGGTEESIFQPAWSPSGELHFVSDRSGWWNLYRLRSGAAGVTGAAESTGNASTPRASGTTSTSGTAEAIGAAGATGNVEALHPMEAEFGVPQWQFAMRTYGFDAQSRIVCLYGQNGDTQLAVLDADSGRFERIDTPYRSMRDLQVDGRYAVCVASSPTSNPAIVVFDLETRTSRVLRAASTTKPAAADISVAEAIRFPTTGGLEAHALFYAPVNAAYRGPAGVRPPLLVISHGGPTSASDAALKWSIQYWTSRGFAVVDVNYGGSTGYGRAYRSRLNGAWGVVDVDDCVNAARYLIAEGRVDASRVAIRGGSAGGYTTLCALTFRDFFKAGASHYGIGDLEALARDTHKFESRYLERLIGPYPQEQALYRERSPIQHIDRLSSAMILLQGEEDKMVPPNQAEAMYAAVKQKGLPVAYLLFPHEQHGFRRAENIRRAYEAELYFYGKVFGFTPADTIEPVEIDNL